MKENGSWGKEPFDLRLTLLRMLRLMPGILGVTALCVLLLWGGYYLKNVVLDREKTYSASATFFIDYADEEWYVNAKYFNDYTWNIWLQSDQFLDAVKGYLAQTAYAGEDPKNLFTAEVPADLRVVIIRSIAADPQTATARIDALKKVLQEDFPAFAQEIREIRVVDTKEASLNVKDLRLGRAFILATVLGLFLAILIFFMREVTLEKIWLPTTLTDRFGLKSLGIPGEKAYEENFKYFFTGKKKLALCGAQEDIDLDEVAKELEGSCKALGAEILKVECPLIKPEGASMLRDADGILLVVKAGGKDAKNLELLLTFLDQQDCKVTAATIWKPDRWLLRNYYRFSFKG